MIILEGVDKAGKSHLARELKKEYPYLEVKNFGIPKGDPIPSYVRELQLYDPGTPMIYDRFYHGEIPYSIVKKRPRYMYDFQLNMLDLILNSMPHLTMYVRPTRETIEERMKTEPDEYVTIPEMQKLYDEYDSVFSETMCNVYMFDGNLTPHAHISIKKVLSIEAFEFWERWRMIGWEGIGTLEPTYLIVGERRNPQAEFQIPMWSESGSFLFKCMNAAGIPLKVCHFTNAVAGFTNIIPEKLIEFLKPRKIICLGNVAWTHLKHVENAVKIPHPSYFKRFKGVNELDYIDMLRQICGR